MSDLKPKILHTEASLGWGGQEIRIITEILSLKNKGYDVSLACPCNSKIFKKAQKNNIEVYDIDLTKRNLKTILKLLKIIKHKKIDIVITHSSKDSWIGALTKIIYPKFKLIRTRHLSTPVSNFILNKFVYLVPDLIITTGEEIRKNLINKNKLKSSKIISIPTGIDTEKFKPKKQKKSNHQIKIGTISVLRSWKGHKYFIKAIPLILQEIPNSEFFIVGDGPQKYNIKKIIKNLNLQKKVHMLGFQENIIPIMNNLDIIVHPSTGHEGVPQSILQALSMEKAVIATKVGSIPEVIINNHTGILIEPFNSEQIAEKVIFLYKNPQLREKLGKEGRKLVKAKYSLEEMTQKIERAINNLLQN